MALAKAKLSAEEIEEIRQRAARAIAPLMPADLARRYQIGTTRTKAGHKLPVYYLVHFLLVDLLKFPHGGRGEKVAWTIPAWNMTEILH